MSRFSNQLVSDGSAVSQKQSHAISRVMKGVRA